MTLTLSVYFLYPGNKITTMLQIVKIQRSLIKDNHPTTYPQDLQIIIIIMSCRLHGFPYPLATSPYCPSPPAGLQGCIPYPHIAAVCMFELVVLLLLGHMWGSIGVHRPYVGVHRSTSLMSSSLLLQQCPALSRNICLLVIIIFLLSL